VKTILAGTASNQLWRTGCRTAPLKPEATELKKWNTDEPTHEILAFVIALLLVLLVK